MNTITKVYLDENGEIKTKVIEQKDFYKSVDNIEIEQEIHRMKNALQRIANLDPNYDSREGYNEWGEADCFNQAQKIAEEALNEKNNWTDANTEKPSAGIEVLVVTEDCGFRNIAIGSWYPHDWLEIAAEGWYLTSYYDDHPANCEITYWMHKPELPK